MRAISVLVFLALSAPLAQAKFFPACLIKDDWASGITRADCKRAHGTWHTAEPLASRLAREERRRRR
jgi:hypothetical protein